MLKNIFLFFAVVILVAAFFAIFGMVGALEQDMISLSQCAKRSGACIVIMAVAEAYILRQTKEATDEV